ncbi:ribosomal-protein-alanine N-acetyltransferase [Clostridium intestinale DSM 6191]|uniref:Ribosomal-protein-alanine N-acetyltransferase n=1 Tax=Clostridium intestinale DSM 6191 TaxID=1121320 RepID=A0A1M5W488_9CLOT|nr:ribosomal-protein-alanine N-acetyltransferase [Clostridium intestinale DSM 6191]
MDKDGTIAISILNIRIGGITVKHLGTVELETERLILRRIKSSDAKPMFDNWASDDEVTKYLTWPTHSSVDISKDVISEWIQNYSDNKFYQWGIALKDNVDEPIGSISVVHMDDDIDMVHIGYCIGRKWWHQGVTSEAFKEVIRFLIEEVGAKRIESRHDSNNPNSGKVMLKCGLQYEGTLRNSDINNQGICNSVMYGLLAEDYYKEKSN